MAKRGRPRKHPLPAPSTKPTCSGCRWSAPREDSATLFCRRYPPQVPVPNFSEFPIVAPKWFCGEYESKPDSN